MAIENFLTNTLIIPMDIAYQNLGMFKAYGLVYDLLKNNIRVKWAIQPGKAFDGTDFTASAVDVQTAAPIVNHAYSGGPFIIDSAYYAQALARVTAWQLAHPNVKVHKATAAFSAPIAATMTRPPRISVEETNSGIMFKYLNIAAIPDSLGNVWTNSSPDVLSEQDMDDGAFFGYDLSACRVIAYDIFLSPHTGDSTWQSAIRKFELNEYLRLGGFLHATCHSVPSIENFAGPFLTQAGIPLTDTNKGDNNSFTVDVPDFPSAQGVSTGQSQNLPGGSFENVYHLEPGLVYNSQTQVLAHFTDNNKQYDFMMAGPYKNGAGGGKIVYEGGHDYSPTDTYSSNDENLYTRFVLDSVFFSVSKPAMFLTYTPTTLFSNVINTITFNIVNTGASPAPNTSFTVTLQPGMTYNGDATIPPTSIVGQTLTWSSAALGTFKPDSIVTFTADYIPPAPVTTKIADYSTSYGDNFKESYNMTGCLTAEVEVFESADLSAVKKVDKQFATTGDTLTYTVTVTNNGTLTALSPEFTDAIPAGTTFVPDSVTIAIPPAAPVPVPGADPSVGFTLPDIPASPNPGSTVEVSFQVTVDDVVSPSDIENQAAIDYSFINTQGTYFSTADSNIVLTQIEVGSVKAVKTANKTVATIGDQITYTVVVTNTGTVYANNVIFTDVPPSGTTFVPLSLTVNGVSDPGNPGLGVSLGSIAPGASVTVAFKVSVTSIPVPPTAINTADVNFTYKVDPQGPDIPGVGLSNPTITDIVNPQLSLVKSSDKTAADLGETIVYSVTVTNTGDVTAQNAVFTDPIPTGTTFIPGSVTVNGISVAGDPVSGIPLGNIPPAGVVTVTFSVNATSIPVPNPTTNIATIQAQYQIQPGEPLKTLSFDSNKREVMIQDAQLTNTKSVSKSFAELGDTLTYSTVINNSGTVTATNVIFKDVTPNGTTLVPGSVTVNGIPTAGDPNVGIPLANILPGQMTTVTFDVTVTSTPVPNPMINTGVIDTDFPVDPLNPVHKTFNTNPVSTKVETASVSVTKSVDKANAEVGDILTYTITVTNTGTVASNNTIITDTPPSGTSFVGGTVTVNGIPDLAANPVTGINAGNIPAGGSAFVTFQVKAEFIPVPNPVSNIAVSTSQFPVDPNNPVTKSFTSNPADTMIKTARLDISKTADKPIVQVGDTVTYSIILSNTGTVQSDNTVFQDVPPAGMTFVPGSVTINGIPSITADPAAGFNVGTIPAGGNVMISFKVTADSVPVPNPTVNIAVTQSTFPVDPLNPVDKQFESPPVPVQITLAELVLNKSIDKPFAEIGETVTYTVSVTNTGTVPANNVIFTDAPPPGTTFVPGSVTVNGVSTAGNPSAGIPIGNIPTGATTTVTFRVTVASVPVPNPTVNTAAVKASYIIDPTKPPIDKNFVSNPVDLTAILAQTEVVKTVDKTSAVLGDILTYNVAVTNTGNIDVDNVVVYDTVPLGAQLVNDSVTIDGVPVPGIDPGNGVEVGTLVPGQTVNVSFKVKATEMPEPPGIVNNALAQFQYMVIPGEPPRSKTQESNDVVTTVEIIDITLVKSADVDRVVKGDIITYTTTVTNNGTLPVSNVIFHDQTPAGTSYVPGSFTVNGIPVPGADPNVGVNLGTIGPGDTMTVRFSVKYEYQPCPPVIVNVADVRFNYRIVTSGPTETGTSESNVIRTEAAPTNFKQLSVEETLTIPPQKPDMEEILGTLAETVIIATRVIKTMKSTSEEGQILTGYKLIIEGMMHQKIEYIADEPTQSVHAAEFNVPFSSFIILPDNFIEGSEIKVTPFIEDIYVKQLDKRHIFKNVTLRLEAAILC